MRTHFSSKEDIQVCQAIHRHYGKSYYYATLRFHESIKWRVHGLYAFVRIADEWVDNPGNLGRAEQRDLLENWLQDAMDGISGKMPSDPVLRVFCDAVTDCEMPVEEIRLFIDAMLMDIDCHRYETYDDLRKYMRGSASAIGVLMCYAMGVTTEASTLNQAMCLGEAMQLTNFLRDIGEDFERGRIYLPREDLIQFGVTESDLSRRRVTLEFKNLLQFEIVRARRLYRDADWGIQQLPVQVRKAVLLARLLYSEILDQIELQDYDVYGRRARTNLQQKATCAAKVALSHDRLLHDLIHSST